MSELPGETGQSERPQEDDTDSDRPTVEIGGGHSPEAFRSDRPTVELAESESTAQSPSPGPRRPPPLPQRKRRPLSSLPPLELSFSEPPEEVARLAELPPVPDPPLGAANVEDPPRLAPPELEPSGPASAPPPGIQPSLDDVPGLQDLPEAAQDELWKLARVTALTLGDPVPPCAMFRVLEGWIDITPATSEYQCGRAASGDVVFTEGTRGRATALRFAAGTSPTVIARWNVEALSSVIRMCPWVEDELRMFGDHLQARAGAVLGKLGSELGETARFVFLDACHLLCVLPWENLMPVGAATDRLHVVGAGNVELLSPSHDEEIVTGELSPGEFVAAQAVLEGKPGTTSVRAGADGALLLYVSRAKLRKLRSIIPGLPALLSAV